MTNRKEEEKAPPKVYIIIDNQKHYIDPDLVKKYSLDKMQVSPFTEKKLHVEGD